MEGKTFKELEKGRKEILKQVKKDMKMWKKYDKEIARLRQEEFEEEKKKSWFEVIMSFFKGKNKNED